VCGLSASSQSSLTSSTASSAQQSRTSTGSVRHALESVVQCASHVYRRSSLLCLPGAYTEDTKAFKASKLVGQDTLGLVPWPSLNVERGLNVDDLPEEQQ